MEDDDSSSSASGPDWSFAVSGSASKTKLGVSSSAVFAVRVACRFVYSLADDVDDVWVIVALSPTPSSSSAAVRVTVRGVFQLLDVNVSVFWTPFRLSPSVSPTVTAVASLLVIVTVASWVGSEDRRTV